MMQLMTVASCHQTGPKEARIHIGWAGPGRAGPTRDPLGETSRCPRVGMRECGATYVVMEGLCLAGVLARLPSVWSGAIQIPEHAGMERGGDGKWRGHRVSQRNKRSKCTTAIHNQWAHSGYLCSTLKAALIHLSVAVRATRRRSRPSSIYSSLTPNADTSLLERSVC